MINETRHALPCDDRNAAPAIPEIPIILPFNAINRTAANPIRQPPNVDSMIVKFAQSICIFHPPFMSFKRQSVTIITRCKIFVVTCQKYDHRKAQLGEHLLPESVNVFAKGDIRLVAIARDKGCSTKIVAILVRRTPVTCSLS